MARTAQISRVRKNEPIKVYFDEEELPAVLQSTVPGDHVVLENGDYTQIKKKIRIPDGVWMTATAGAIVDHKKVKGHYEGFVDLNKLARLSIGDLSNIQRFGDHLNDYDNPHHVTPEQVESYHPHWNAGYIQGYRVMPNVPKDGDVLRYSATHDRIEWVQGGSGSSGGNVDEAWVESFVNGWFEEKTTDDLAEGLQNLYFTEDRIANHDLIQQLLRDTHVQDTDSFLSKGTENEVSSLELREHLDNESIHFPVDDSQFSATNLWSSQKIWDELHEISLINLTDDILDYLIEGVQIEFWVEPSQRIQPVGKTLNSLTFHWDTNVLADSIVIRDENGNTYTVDDVNADSITIDGLGFVLDGEGEKTFYLESMIGSKIITKEATIYAGYRYFYGAANSYSFNDVSNLESSIMVGNEERHLIDCSVNGPNHWVVAWPTELEHDVTFLAADSDFELTWIEQDPVSYVDSFGNQRDYYLFFGPTQTSYSRVEIKIRREWRQI